MASPYEGIDQNLIGEVQNLNIDTESVTDAVTTTVKNITDQNLVASAQTNASTEVVETKPFKGDTYAKRKQRNDAFYAWRKLPDGPDKDTAANDWAMKYHGKSYAEYETEKNKDKGSGFMYQGSTFYNQEKMMSIPAGGIDWLTDLGNWASKPIRQPLKISEIPKIPKFEDQGATAMREISSLILPFYLLKGKTLAGGQAIQQSKIAAKYSPWLYRLGNNPAFQRFAKIGLDMGVGGFVDSINKVNSMNDTLATSWKRGKWWGHNLIPEHWTSDKLSPDQKHRANVLEGYRFGWYSNVAEGFVKLIRAGRSTGAVTQYLSEAGKKSKKLDELVIDPLDAKVFDETNTMSDSILRGEAKYQRDLNSLTEYYKNSNKLEVNKPTVGIHQFSDETQAGIRTKDFDGIIGAAKDQAQIATNTGTTFGRLGNMLTEGFRKSGLDDTVIRDRSLINSLRDDLVKGGKYSVKLPDGQLLTAKQINNEGTILAEIISDPTLPRGSLNKILANFKTTVEGVEKLNKVGMNAVDKASKRILKDWADINTDKTTAYLLTSEAGQISDMAEGARILKDSKGVARGNEQFLDRLELFEIESKIADFNFKGRKSLLASIQADPANATNLIKQLDRQYTSKLSEIIPEAKKLRTMLEGIQESSPEFAEAIRMAYEMADGNVRTIKDLNNHITQSFGTFNKAFIDTQPEIPSFIYKSFMGNVFNNMLSALGTPVRAMYGNFGGFISEPVSVFYGALREMDVVQLRRASHMYFGFSDTFQQGFKYMGKMFRKAAVSPDDVRDFTRRDFDGGTLSNMKLNEEIAAAAAKKGEHGPESILGWATELDAMGKHPWFRFGPNAMTGLDGFTQATQKVAIDKAQAFDDLLMKYPDGKWGKEEFQEVFQNIHNKGRDANGFIKSEAVDYARSEIALNLNTDLVKGLNPVLKRVPVLRSILWFPRTQMNVVNMFGKYAPRPFQTFLGDYAEFHGKMGLKQLDDFSPEEMINSLTKRGKYVKSDSLDVIKAKFQHLRHMTRGRVGMGNVAVIGAGVLASQGRIRGYGHYDPSVQKTRNSQGWERKTIQGLDGKWYSYEFLGPLGDWLATTVTAIDNFDATGTGTLENQLKKQGFILGGAVTDQGVLGSLEPLFDILSGNEAAVVRWRTQMENSLFPLSSYRNELGKILYGALREVNNRDVAEMARNKNNWLDVLDPLGAQPDLINFIDGKPINRQGESIIARGAKTIFGFGGTANQSKESQFLIDIEFDMIPQFNVASNGVKYTSDQKSELKQLMGEDGYFNRELQTIMKQAEQVTYTTPQGKTIVGYTDVMRHFRRTGRGSDQIEEYSRIMKLTESALRTAMSRVESRLSTYDQIKLDGQLQTQIKSSAESQNDDKLNELLEIN